MLRTTSFIQSEYLLKSISEPSFSPTDLANCTAWYDSDTTSGQFFIASGGLVSQWTDRSGNSNHATQGTASNQPGTGNSTINGLNAFDFNGFDDWFGMPTSGSLMINSSDYEIFFLAQTSSSAIQFLQSYSSFHYETHINGASGARFIPVGASPYSDVGTNTQYSDGSPHIFSIRVESGTGYVNVDGTDGNARSSATSSLNVSGGMGIRVGGGLPFNGLIGEYICYSRALNTSERSQVSTYLNTKWGV